ncbi:hypothetical protein [Planctopirus hydrillae]|uniref:Uncharacterized protein n=1 Tax=Planctopirus hydrillae TaxID=1841610 RepID=A0A1C3EP09_9PLAN|nr:hypothetical protein [Planctopirus hydrillae]ODA34962.1 hypothetical protein A6X21_04815 [Planctopirus hydrillae]
MPSHLSSIGLPVSDKADFAALADRIGPLAIPIEVDDGIYWRWSSECGAEMWLQTNADNELVGMTPFFSGKSRVRVRLNARVTRHGDTPLEGAFHGWADPDENDPESGAFPFVFDAVDYCKYNDVILPSIVHSQIAAFAHEISVYPTLDAYNASQTGELRFASQSFIPSGLFSSEGGSTEPPSSTAIFTGHVAETATKTNSLTGSKYYWAQVDTLGGSFDVLIDPELCHTTPVVGGVVSGSFWLCGRIIE